MRTENVLRQLAQLIDARARCVRDGKTEWSERHTGTILTMIEDVFPHGSGVDQGTTIDLQASHADKIILTLSFHHMNEHGYYDGWTDHRVTITPSLAFGFRIQMTGSNRHQVKDYLTETLEYVLSSQVEWSYEADTNTPRFRLLPHVPVTT